MLGALLLRAGEVVSDVRLVDEIWDQRPPPSAAHSLEAYVSRLRHELAPHGVSLERRGGGYRIDIGSAILDSQAFVALTEEACTVASAGDYERAAAIANDALDLWRGPVLAGVPVHLDGAGTQHLDEVRFQAIEAYADANLTLGRHRELVGELRRLVDENPYREELVARLMLALYRSGRQAEALEQYESTRRLLTDDLGIQPGPELQRLSGQIVRHEHGLTLPSTAASPPGWTRRTHRLVGALALVVIVAALAAAVVGLTWGSDAGEPTGTAAAGTRVALVLPRAPQAGHEDTFVTPFVNGLLRAAREYELDTRTFVVDEFQPSPARLKTIRHELRMGDFDLVFWAGFGRAASELLPLVRRLPTTRFVYVDASLEGTPIEDAPNATALTFADDGAGFLAGYLAGLVPGRRSPSGRRNSIVSVIGGYPIPQVTALIEGFARGARKARPGIAVRVDYSRTFVDQSVCERIANRQIDRGSTVIFAPAGTCGLGALSAAALRGVWGVGADADRSYLGSHILVSTFKRHDRAVELAVMWFVMGTLPAGDVVLGLDDDAVGITGISPEVSPQERTSVAQLAASVRNAEAMPNP